LQVEQTKKYFDSIAKDYLRATASFPWNIIRKKEFRQMQVILADQAFQNTLELGCGAGFYTGLLSECTEEKVTAIDISLKMLEQFSYKNVEKVNSAIEEFTPPREFDLVFSVGSIEFLDSPKKFFKLAKESLGKNGTLIIVVPHKGFLTRSYQLFHLIGKREIKLYSRDELLSIAAEHQFSLAESHPFAPFNHYYQFKIK
jgi:SAM-dependent methyltransferase